MRRLARYALVAVVTVASLSVGAHALVEDGPSGYGTAACASGEISAFPVDDESVRDVRTSHEDLGERERRAVDRARSRTNRTASLDPSLVDELPESVVVEGTVYRISTRATDCPIVAGTPRATNWILLPLFAVYELFSPLYLPGAAVVCLGVAYRYVDDWLRFD